jgi:hypothetical protein
MLLESHMDVSLVIGSKIPVRWNDCLFSGETQVLRENPHEGSLRCLMQSTTGMIAVNQQQGHGR